MDIRKVKKLIELLDESGIAEIEITEGEESVRISRYAAGAPVAAARSRPLRRRLRSRLPWQLRRPLQYRRLAKKMALRLLRRWLARFTAHRRQAPRPISR